MKFTKNTRVAFVNAVMADLPTVDYKGVISSDALKDAIAALPAPVKKLLPSGYVQHHTVTHYGCAAPVSACLPAVSREEAQEFLSKACTKHEDAWYKQVETRESLRSRLDTISNNCSTTEQLAKQFPEFTNYLPKEEAKVTQNLPALVNVLEDFTKAGWPKKKTEAA